MKVATLGLRSAAMIVAMQMGHQMTMRERSLRETYGDDVLLPDISESVLKSPGPFTPQPAVTNQMEPRDVQALNAAQAKRARKNASRLRAAAIRSGEQK